MNINGIIQQIKHGSVQGSGNFIRFPCPTAEVFVEMMDESVYQNLLDASGVYDVRCKLVAGGVAHNVTWKVIAEDLQFELSGI